MAVAGRIYVNGRFLRGPITGTSRVAEEILAAWDQRLAADDAFRRRYEIVLLRPRRRLRDLSLTHIRQQDAHYVGGKLWELFDLPLAARAGALVNFANIAPFAHPRSIVYLHDAQMFMVPESFPPRIRLSHQPLMRIAGRASRRVVTISDFSARMLAHYRVARRDKITVIHNGADHILRAPENGEVLQRFNLAPKSYVLMFGSGFPYKNNRIVYEAYRLMGAEAPPLAVIGRADDAARIGAALDGGVAGVTLLSGLSDSDLRTLYANALVFAAPSRTEGYPMTPLEALNCGCPAIATPEASMPEILGDGVDYAGADDAAGWAKAIISHKNDPSRRDLMAGRGREVASSKTWAAAAERLLEEIERLDRG